jgi:hypothetical protein
VHVRERHELAHVGRVRQNFLRARPRIGMSTRTWRKSDRTCRARKGGGGLCTLVDELQP